MLSNQIQAALNAQMNLELRSFYTYLAMSAYCEFNNFPGLHTGCGNKVTKSNSTA